MRRKIHADIRRAAQACVLAIAGFSHAPAQTDTLSALRSDTTRLPHVPSRSPRYTVSLSAAANASYLIPMDEQCRAIMHNYGTSFYALTAGFQAKEAEATDYDRDYGLPTLEVGLLLGDYSHIRLYRQSPRLPYDSGMGYAVAAYGAFRRDLFVSPGSRWRIGYALENGIGFCTHPYNTRRNADNEILGSTYAVYLGLGLYAAYRPAPQWEVGIGADYKHFSNSALDRPNKGANTIGLTARATYYLTPPDLLPRSQVRARASFRKYFYVDISAGFAAKSLQDDWVVNYWERSPDDPRYRSSHYPIYGAFTCAVAPMYRYSRRYASGIGFDYTYAPYADRLHASDLARDRYPYKYSRHVLGIGLRHEVYFRHLSLSMGLGWYALRRMGYTADVDEKPYYETIGLRYAFPFTQDRLYIGYNVKAHFTKADCFQLVLGWRAGKRTRKDDMRVTQ
ncbi:MAG: acyloxyacyl hydrolase [Alloprevotella sp.]|nr:acyloxyacyl hydrolase [Alloprevotella sp.]